jgi:hypothetical protein
LVYNCVPFFFPAYLLINNIKEKRINSEISSVVELLQRLPIGNGAIKAWNKALLYYAW